VCMACYGPRPFPPDTHHVEKPGCMPCSRDLQCFVYIELHKEETKGRAGMLLKQYFCRIGLEGNRFEWFHHRQETARWIFFQRFADGQLSGKMKAEVLFMRHKATGLLLR